MKSQGDKMKLIFDKEINLKKATTFKKRLLGLMFKTNIQEGLVFKTKAIHTFFMKEEIDVIITDKNNKTIVFYKNLKRNKIIIILKSYYIYELPKNSINNLKKGDKLTIL